MAVKPCLGAGVVLAATEAEDLPACRGQHTALDQLTDAAARLEGGIQCQPRLRPEQALFNLGIDFGLDVLVLDIEETLHEGAVVAQHPIQYAEGVHTHPIPLEGDQPANADLDREATHPG